MEENEDRGQNITLVLLLLISFILLFVDSLELYGLIQNWEFGTSVISPIFESCIKWELYNKSIFSIFSFLGAVSAFMLTLFLLINSTYFAENILATFLYFNYVVFGPYMLGFCILGFINWNNVVYQCDRQSFNNKLFSISNFFSLIACFILSLMVTLLVSVYKTINIYVDSILRKPKGSFILRKLFWWTIFRNREPVEFVRRTVNNNNNNEERGNV